MDFSEIFKKAPSGGGKGGGNPNHDSKGRFASSPGTRTTHATPTPGPKNGKTYTAAEINASLTRMSKSGAFDTSNDPYEHSFVVKGTLVSQKDFAKAFLIATEGKALPEDLMHAITGEGAKISGDKPWVRLQVAPPPEDGVSPANPKHVSVGTSRVSVNGIPTISVDRNYNFATNTVDHTYFSLDKKVQGDGISKALFKNALPVYDKLGMERITTHANLDAGGYVWGRYGFKASDPADHKHFVGYDASEASMNKRLIARWAMGAGKQLERAFRRLPQPLPDDVAREVKYYRSVIAVGKTPGVKGNEHAWKEFPRAYTNGSVKAILRHLATSPNARTRKYVALLTQKNPRSLLIRGLQEKRSITRLSTGKVLVTRSQNHWYGELDLKHKRTREHLDNYLK